MTDEHHGVYSEIRQSGERIRDEFQAHHDRLSRELQALEASIANRRERIERLEGTVNSLDRRVKALESRVGEAAQTMRSLTRDVKQFSIYIPLLERGKMLYSIVFLAFTTLLGTTGGVAVLKLLGVPL